MIRNEDDKLRDEIHSEQALRQLKLRSPLLAKLRHPEFTSMEKCVPITLAVLIIYYAFNVFPDDTEATFLIIFLVTLIFITSSYQTNHVNRRIEALIELIGEDNLLQVNQKKPQRKTPS